MYVCRVEIVELLLHPEIDIDLVSLPSLTINSELVGSVVCRFLKKPAKVSYVLNIITVLPRKTKFREHP